MKHADPVSHARRVTSAARFSGRRSAGLTLMELLIALPIIAMLLTATMVAIDVSFQAYSSAARESATQASTRMVVHRLLTLIRTSTAHGPLLPTSDPDWPVTINGDLLSASFLELIDPQNNRIRIEYRAAVQELWVSRTDLNTGTVTVEPLLGNVESAVFTARRRLDRTNTFVLERATMDIAVRSDQEGVLSIEGQASEPLRVIASTAPRKLE